MQSAYSTSYPYLSCIVKRNNDVLRESYSLFLRRVLFIYPRQFALHLMNGGGRFPGSKTFVLA